MMTIVRMSRQQFSNLVSHIHPTKRWTLTGLTISHCYICEPNMLFVVDDDVKFIEAPPENLTIASLAALSAVKQ